MSNLEFRCFATRIHITWLYGIPFWAHGVPSLMWGGSVFDLVIVFQSILFFSLGHIVTSFVGCGEISENQIQNRIARRTGISISPSTGARCGYNATPGL